jgi:hypothetical protein
MLVLFPQAQFDLLVTDCRKQCSDTLGLVMNLLRVMDHNRCVMKVVVPKVLIEKSIVSTPVEVVVPKVLVEKSMVPTPVEIDLLMMAVTVLEMTIVMMGN